MIIDGVLRRLDGKYDVAIVIQDGVERTMGLPTLRQAKQIWKKGHKILNGVDKSVSECRVWNQVKRVVVDIERAK